MENMKNTLISAGVSAGVAVLVVVLGFVFFGSKPTIVERVVGSASSPSVNGGCMDVNGMNLCSYRTGMTAASTTCSFRTAASSTLMYAAVHVVTAPGAFDIEFGKSDNLMSTTTSLGKQSVANKATPTVLASSTPVAGGDAVSQFFNAGQYLNIKLASSSVSSLVSGTCSAVFWQI